MIRSKEWHYVVFSDENPVRGMQFLVPANAWFCKLCSVWIGDLHCASAHLKSRLHSNKYQVSSNIHLLKLL